MKYCDSTADIDVIRLMMIGVSFPQMDATNFVSFIKFSFPTAQTSLSFGNRQSNLFLNSFSFIHFFFIAAAAAAKRIGTFRLKPATLHPIEIFSL